VTNVLTYKHTNGRTKLSKKVFKKIHPLTPKIPGALLVEICIDDISAVLRATDLRFRLPLIILRILKFLNLLKKLQIKRKSVLIFFFKCLMAQKDAIQDNLFGTIFKIGIF
jgi:hypothetical protein